MEYRIVVFVYKNNGKMGIEYPGQPCDSFGRLMQTAKYIYDNYICHDDVRHIDVCIHPFPIPINGFPCITGTVSKWDETGAIWKHDASGSKVL